MHTTRLSLELKSNAAPLILAAGLWNLQFLFLTLCDFSAQHSALPCDDGEDDDAIVLWISTCFLIIYFFHLKDDRDFCKVVSPAWMTTGMASPEMPLLPFCCLCGWWPKDLAPCLSWLIASLYLACIFWELPEVPLSTGITLLPPCLLHYRSLLFSL